MRPDLPLPPSARHTVPPVIYGSPTSAWLPWRLARLPTAWAPAAFRRAASRIPRRAGSRTMARGSHRRPTARLALFALVLSLLCRGQPAASQETLSTFLGDLGLGDAEAPFAGRHALQCHSSLPVLMLRTRVRLC